LELAELFVHHDSETPDALRMRLSQVFNILRSRSSKSTTPEPTEDGHVIDRLAKLADLLDRDLLSRQEFDRLKADLL
jgi:hypothetical protein